MRRTTRSSWSSVRCSRRVCSLLEFDKRLNKLHEVEGIRLPMVTKALNKIEHSKSAAPGALQQQRRRQKSLKRRLELISRSVERIEKDYN